MLTWEMGFEYPTGWYRMKLSHADAGDSSSPRREFHITFKASEG